MTSKPPRDFALEAEKWRKQNGANTLEIRTTTEFHDRFIIIDGGAPELSPSRVMQEIKGKTSHHLLQDYRRLRKEFWGRHLWARGYFAATTGSVSDEMVAQYMENQDADIRDDDFTVSG